jgi:hypothetical protein
MSRVVAKEYRRYASGALSYEYRRPASHGDVRVTA